MADVHLACLASLEFNNFLDGTEADNIINGGAGADTMNGWGGNETFIVDRSRRLPVRSTVAISQRA